MSPLFMESVCEAGSPGSPSAEEDHSHAAGSGREGGPPVGPRGSKRREKNRNAARKSRQKQTERADELHKELQSLEHSNSALHKEIAALKKDLHKYETILKHHEPHCRLGASPSGPGGLGGPAHPSTSYPGNQSSSVAAPRSHSTSVTSSKGHKILKGVEKPPFKSAELIRRPFPSAEPAAVSSSQGAVASLDLFPHSASLFSCSKEPPVTSKAASSSFAGALLNTAPSSSTAAHQPAPVTLNACFTAGTFPPDQDSFFSPSAALPFFSDPKVDPYGALTIGCPPEAPQPPPFHFGVGSDPLTSFLLPPPDSPAPLLSQLTVPAPLDILQATSSGFDESLGPLAPPPREAPSDLLLEINDFLETNDWILGGTNDKQL